MKLSINTHELDKQKGHWIATVDWFKVPVEVVGIPGAIKYGESKKEAYNKLKKHLTNLGHEVIN